MAITTLDRQFEELPKKIVYCKNCVVSNQGREQSLTKRALFRLRMGL